MSKSSHKSKQELFPPKILIEASHRGHTAHPDPSGRRRNHETVPALDSRIAQCGTPTLRPRSRAREPQRLFSEKREHAVVRRCPACDSTQANSLTLWIFSCSFISSPFFFSQRGKASLQIHSTDTRTSMMRGLQYQYRLP